MESFGDKDFTNDMFKILHDKFRLDNFRSMQREIIEAVLNKHDCLVLMPTKSGKSLCYQLPALLTEGVTIVISPTISAITDQVNKLTELGIRAAHLCSTLSTDEFDQNIEKLCSKNPEIDLLYVTPERILGLPQSEEPTLKPFVHALNSLYSRGKLARFVFDEVHYLSSWGSGFRPDYEKLAVLRKDYNDIQILYVTGAMRPSHADIIIDKLQLKNVRKFIQQGFNRPNIKYQVMDKHPETVDDEITKLIKLKFTGKTGIVYCLKKKDCDDLSSYLNVRGIAAKPYHSGLEDTVREETQTGWMQNKFDVIVATVALGMGIDKPNIRFIIHNTIPKSVEAYYQESGRAGKDEQVAYSYLFYNYDDVGRTRDSMERHRRNSLSLQDAGNLEQMRLFAENTVDCRRVVLLSNLEESFDRNLCMQNEETRCDNCERRNQPLAVQ